MDIIYLDNLYAYGPCTTPFIETSPYTPNSVKGRIRASAAEQLMALSGKGQVRVCIVRAASFFGPGVETSVVGKQALVGALTGGTVYLLGDPTQPHTLTYLPDAITALIRLAEEPMAYGHAWHVPNDCQGSVRELLAQVAQGSPKKMQERIAGRTMVRMIGLFNPLMREQREMMYMYEQAFRVSHAKTAKTFNLRATPVKQAIAESVAWARAQS